MIHTLIVTDHSGERLERDTLRFASIEEAVGHIVRRGTMAGMLEYTLNGRPLRFSASANPVGLDVYNQLCGGSDEIGKAMIGYHEGNLSRMQNAATLKATGAL